MLAVQQGGRVLEMNAPVTQPGLLHLLTMHTEEGRRIYERSVRFLLLAATNRILPGQRVRIEYSVSGGVLLRMPGHAITEEETRAIARQMHALAAQNLPFEKKEWTLDDAIAYFDAQGQADKVALLSPPNNAVLPYVRAGRYVGIFLRRNGDAHGHDAGL